MRGRVGEGATQNPKSKIHNLRAWLPTLELGCAVLAGALWYLQGGAVWYAGDWPGPWPLLLLALLWIFRLLYVRLTPRDAASSRPPVVRFTPFSFPLLLFLLSAAVGLWAAYDPSRAWAKAWLIIGALGLYWALAQQPTLKHLYLALSFWGVFGIVLTGYFFVTHDWASQTVKVPALVALGQAISARLPRLAAHRISPNVVGGMLAVVLPYYVPLIVLPGKEPLALSPGWRRALRLCWSLALALALLGWLVASSRGAWIALLGGGAVWGLWRALGRWMKYGRGGHRRRSARVWSLRLRWMAGLLTVGALLAAGAAALILSRDLPGAASLANRLSLLRTSALLARDTPLTGIGLGMFEMHFSIYTLLIHVGYIVNSHNLLLDMAIEQGVVGALATIGLAVTAVVVGLRLLRRAPQAHAWIIEAALTALLVGLVHGMVDDILYGSRALLLLFVPLGWLAAEIPALNAVSPEEASSRRRRSPWALAGFLTVTMIVISFVCLRGGVWYANLGAVAQARVELNRYDQHHFDNPTMDQVRQQEDLSVAIAWFERALAANPGNLTAQQRLAAIDLARGDYSAALTLLQAAWDAGHRDAVTRLLYGDALVAQGRVTEAVEVIRGLPFAQARLLGEAWSRYHLGQDPVREAYAREAAAALGE